jgi:hypothetical protein
MPLRNILFGEGALGLSDCLMFYWWRKPENTATTTDMSQISEHFYYIMDWLFIARRLEPNMPFILRTRTSTKLQQKIKINEE